MTLFKDPPRLLESEATPGKLRSWLERAQNDAPSPAEVEQVLRLAESCGRASLPSASPGALPKAAPKGVTTAALGKVVLAVSAVGLGLGLWWFLAKADHRGAARSHDLQPSAPAQTAPDVTPSSAGSAEPGPEVPINPEPSAAPVRQRQRSIPSAPKERRAHADATASAPVTQGSSSPDSTDEYRLLRDARQALSSDPGRALALSAEHARRFPGGMLAQEREAIAIEALLRLGRNGEARTRAQTFLRRYPTSPYRSRVEAAVNQGREE